MSDFDVVIIGAGAAGIATAAGLLRRQKTLSIAIIDGSEAHYYQPGWTMVGGGVFDPAVTARATAQVIPKGVKWIRAHVTRFMPQKNTVVLADKSLVTYQQLVVCPGLKLDWDAVAGLPEALGKNGVTSNYRFDLAPYTWQLANSLRGGKAIFTQPPMPIKCAGAPQKAMYLTADRFKRRGVLSNIDIEFCNAGGVLFGVADYVPALMTYVEKYGAALSFNHNLVAIDGAAQKAWFSVTDGKKTKKIEKSFDMIHVCPPQTAPDFIQKSPLADAAGWVDVDHETLRHTKYENIFGLGDATCTPNAKTAAAARKQAPVVATNIVHAMGKSKHQAVYDGYGSCPLTVERGRIVLAEFGYGGKIIPTFPTWLVQGLVATRRSWFLKSRILPWVYWNLMLRGIEWFAHPILRSSK